eukprot:COSAG01_NODE_18964_length_1040_cov_1.148778_3_plen_28_part_01
MQSMSMREVIRLISHHVANLTWLAHARV